MSTGEFFVAAGVSPGLLIRLERIRRGLRQVDLAAMAGVTQGEVSALERGASYICPAARRRIFRALELDAGEGS